MKQKSTLHHFLKQRTHYRTSIIKCRPCVSNLIQWVLHDNVLVWCIQFRICIIGFTFSFFIQQLYYVFLEYKYNGKSMYNGEFSGTKVSIQHIYSLNSYYIQKLSKSATLVFISLITFKFYVIWLKNQELNVKVLIGFVYPPILQENTRIIKIK